MSYPQYQPPAPAPKKKSKAPKVAIIVGALAALGLIGGAIGAAGGGSSPTTPAATSHAACPEPSTTPTPPADGSSVAWNSFTCQWDSIPGTADAPAAPTPATAPTPEPAKPSGPATSVSDGTYEVGVDIEPGKYKGDCDAFSYWARLKHNDGSIGDIIANNLLSAPGRMQFTTKTGEYVEVRGCEFTKAG